MLPIPSQSSFNQRHTVLATVQYIRTNLLYSCTAVAQAVAQAVAVWHSTGADDGLLAVWHTFTRDQDNSQITPPPKIHESGSTTCGRAGCAARLRECMSWSRRAQCVLAALGARRFLRRALWQRRGRQRAPDDQRCVLIRGGARPRQPVRAGRLVL